MSIKGIQRQLLHYALKRHGGNRTKAAKDLGVSIRTVRNWLKAYGDTPQGKPEYGPGYLDGVIAQEIERAMALANGHKHRAAEMLGMSYATLYKRLKINPNTQKWTAKRHAKPVMICTECNGRMNARSWTTRHVITRGKDYIVRRGPGRSIWYCIRHGAGKRAYIEAKKEATKVKRASPYVTKKVAAQIKKSLQSY